MGGEGGLPETDGKNELESIFSTEPAAVGKGRTCSQPLPLRMRPGPAGHRVSNHG